MLLFKRVFTVSFFTLISRVLGFVRDIMIAHHFGTGPVADAFFAAFKLPNVFRRMFAEGAMQSAFIPIYAGLLAKEGEDNAAAFSRRVLFYLSLTLLVVMMTSPGGCTPAAPAALPREEGCRGSGRRKLSLACS